MGIQACIQKITGKPCQLRREPLRLRPFLAISIGLSVLALAGTGSAQQNPPRPPMLNPPALPANPPNASKATFGPTLTNGIHPSFTVPNTTTWTALGPAPLNEGGAASGRIAGVAVDPNNSSNIYVAAAGGGVWQSTDGGSTYTPLTDTQATLSMGAIAVVPSSTNSGKLRIYAGTGEANNSLDSNFGLGILMSNDSGATWTLSTGPSGVFTSSRLAVSKISVDPTTDLTAYAAVNDFAENGICCANTGIFKTTDGGTTWSNTTVSIDSLYPWSDVVVDPNNASIIYAAHGDPFNENATNGVYRSLNGGSTWNVLANCPHGANGRIALAVAKSAVTPGSHVLYVAIATAYSGGSVLFEMLVSNNADAGTPTFSNETNTPNFGGSGGQAWYDWIIAVDPSNKDNVYAAGALNYGANSNHVIRSTNGTAGGSTTVWTDITTVGSIQPHTDSHGMAIDSSSRLLLGNDGGLWRYDPASGGSWTNLNGNLNTIQFTGIGLHPTNNQIVIGGSQDNGTELTTGSNPWASVDGGDGGYSQISQTNGNICYANHPIGSFGPTTFFRVSTDGCSIFGSATPPGISGSGFNFYAPIFVDPSNGNRVFLGGDKLYESPSEGSSGTWTGHTSPTANPINSIAVLPGLNVIYISTGGTFGGGAGVAQIWVSTNDGSTWALAPSLPGNGAIQEVDIDPNDATGNTAVAVINQFNGANGQVFRTTNGLLGATATWTNISGNLPAIPTWSAKIDPAVAAKYYVSNETGVYSSSSPFTTWTAVGSGLPNAQGVHLELNESLHVLAVATHGRGAWYFSTASVSLTSPTIAKAFSPATIQSVGGSSTVTLTLSNSNASALTGAAFTDTLVNMSAPSGPTSVTGTCAGTTPSSLIAGQTSLSFSGITIPASGSCTVIFGVVSSTPGVLPNSTSGVTTTQTPTAGSGSNTANLTVLAAPTIAKAFNPTSIASGGTSVVTLTLTNSNASALTGAAFTDTLTNMSTAAGSVAGTCTGTTPTSFSGGQTALSFTGIFIPTSGSCTVTFTVTSANLGGNNNQTSGVATTQTSTAGSVSNIATLTVTSGPTVVSYNVICGTSCLYNMVGGTRVHLPWQITGVQVVFSQVITSADASSLTGVSVGGFSGLGSNTLTWTFTGVTNGNLPTALATTGPHAIQSVGGTLAGSNTSFALKILQGDMNDDGVVNSQDLVLVNNARSQAYNIFADINGDGVVNTADVLVVQHQLGQSNH